MKKIISLLIWFLNLLIIAGCSNTDPKMFDTLAFLLWYMQMSSVRIWIIFVILHHLELIPKL